MKTLILAAALVFSSMNGARAVPMNSIYDDYPVQCGATYFLYWKGFELKKATEQAEAYRKKFESLYAIAVPRLEKRGLDQKAADAYIQDHVNMMVRLAEDDDYVRALAGFRTLCDRKFPELQ
ncbi:hypothetical protein [Ensifer sp. MJa1]|uniref:hypothetical protein n=1 Tax=Ensifer sp. MJa1 TaxID=2919888 RepID=UPI003008083B